MVVDRPRLLRHSARRKGTRFRVDALGVNCPMKGSRCAKVAVLLTSQAGHPPPRIDAERYADSPAAEAAMVCREVWSAVGSTRR